MSEQRFVELVRALDVHEVRSVRNYDKARVGAFNDKIQFNARWSNDRDQLITDVKNLDYGNGTRLWDAVGASLDELKAMEGRKVILVFTDGDDTESRMRLGTVIDRARADEVMIYAIGLESNYFNGQQRVRTKPDSGLRKIADECGALPWQGARFVMRDRRVHRQCDGRHFGRWPEAQVDALDIAICSALLQQLDKPTPNADRSLAYIVAATPGQSFRIEQEQ